MVVGRALFDNSALLRVWGWGGGGGGVPHQPASPLAPPPPTLPLGSAGAARATSAGGLGVRTVQWALRELPNSRRGALCDCGAAQQPTGGGGVRAH